MLDKQQAVKGRPKFNSGWDLGKWLELVTANANTAIFLGFICAHSQSQHPPTQWSWGAADEAVLNKLRKNQGHWLKARKYLKVTRPAEG
jgi:hypothetical protein